MNLNGIDATLNQLVQQLPKGLAQREVKDTFEALIESLRNQIKTAIEEAAAEKASPAAAAPATAVPANAPTTAATPAVPASGDHAPSPTRTTAALSAYQRSFLRNPDGPLYDQLSNELTSASSLYNERESILREGLDLGAIESHLRQVAASHEIEFHKSDLDGILRNSGYGAAHLGSTERYMAAVQKFISEAENNYRQRAGNIPGSGSNA